MKKKLLILILSIISVVCLAIGLAACDNATGDKNNNSEQNSQSDNNSNNNSDTDNSENGNQDETLNYSEGLEFKLSNDGTYYSVTGIGTCQDTDIVIPSIYNNLPVTTIGTSVFSDCVSITNLTIPNSITTINSFAFNNCTSLAKVTIADGVSSFGNFVFYGCNALECILCHLLVRH